MFACCQSLDLMWCATAQISLGNSLVFFFPSKNLREVANLIGVVTRIAWFFPPALFHSKVAFLPPFFLWYLLKEMIKHVDAPTYIRGQDKIHAVLSVLLWVLKAYQTRKNTQVCVCNYGHNLKQFRPAQPTSLPIRMVVCGGWRLTVHWPNSSPPVVAQKCLLALLRHRQVSVGLVPGLVLV